MKDKIIEILGMPKSEESINALCELCGILKFQAINIIDEYQEIVKTTTSMLESGMDISNYNVEKQNILRGLTSGEYSRRKKEDLNNEVIKILKMQVSEESINKLCVACLLEYQDAKNIIEKYQNIENAEMSAISNGQDASSLNIEKWNIIKELSTIKEN